MHVRFLEELKGSLSKITYLAQNLHTHCFPVNQAKRHGSEVIARANQERHPKESHKEYKNWSCKSDFFLSLSLTLLTSFTSPRFEGDALLNSLFF